MAKSKNILDKLSDNKEDKKEKNNQNNNMEIESGSSHDKEFPEEQEEGQLTVDVYETNDNIIIKSPIAGVKKENIDVDISNDMVTIRGLRENEDQPSRDDFFFQELYWGTFSRSIILPQEVEVDKARAIAKNGMLTIQMPKVEKDETRHLDIHVE